MNSKLRLSFIFITIVTLLFSCKKQAQETLTISGSETMHAMVEQIGKDFSSKVETIQLEVTGGGSTEGISELISGKSDMAMSSRDVTEVELSSLKKKQANVEKLVVAYDGIAIVTNTKNPVSKLNLNQISEIFKGNIQNWKEVGGADAKIELAIRDDKSGTSKFFKDHVLNKKDVLETVFVDANQISFGKNATVLKDNAEIADFLSKHPNAIGYMGMGSALVESKGKVKAVAYAKTDKDEFVIPTPKTVYERKYKLSRPLYIIYFPDYSKKVETFVTYLTSEEGQNSILRSGYLRSSLPEVEVESTKINP